MKAIFSSCQTELVEVKKKQSDFDELIFRR